MDNMPTVYQFFRRTIPAGDTTRVNAYSNYVTILSSTGSSNIWMSISGQAMQEIPKGLSVELPPGQSFSYLDFYNSEGVPVTIEVSLSSGKILDSRNVITGEVQTDKATDTISTPAAVAVAAAAPGVPTIAANANRREIFIQNNGANDFWVGDSNVDGLNNRGIKVVVGDAVVLETKAAIYLRTGAGASTASYAEFER